MTADSSSSLASGLGARFVNGGSGTGAGRMSKSNLSFSPGFWKWLAVVDVCSVVAANWLVCWMSGVFFPPPISQQRDFGMKA